MIADSPTAAPTAVDALVALARASLTGVQVVDGPVGALTLDNDVLIVGWSDGTTPAILLTRGEPDLGGRQREEGDVVCVADCYSGDADFAALRTRAQTVVADLEAALKAQPGIGGAVDGAWYGDAMEWTQRDAGDGCAVRVAFAVHYVAEL